MNSFIFVAIVCMGANNCDFIASNKPISQAQCQQVKKQYLSLPFKPEVTMAAAQCMPFEEVKMI